MPNQPKSKFTEHDWIVEAFHSKFKSEMGCKWLLNDEDLIQVVNTVNYMGFEDYNSIGMTLPQLMLNYNINKGGNTLTDQIKQPIDEDGHSIIDNWVASKIQDDEMF